MKLSPVAVAAVSLAGGAFLGSFLSGRGMISEVEDLRQKVELVEELQRQIEHLAASSSSSSPRSAGDHAVPSNRALQLQGTCSGSCTLTYASDYGAVGDSVTDDTAAIQAAIDAAAASTHNNGTGGTVILPPGTFFTTSPLVIPGGVTLQGQGYGSSPLAIQFDSGGSVIAYCGAEHAVIINGHAASLRDLAVYDWRYPVGSHCDNVKAAGGVLVQGDGRLTESVVLSRVFIYWFMGGTGLTLLAKNNGGVPFGSYRDLRVRHAKVGIHIVAEEGSFVNSNRFHNGAVTGEMTDIAILAEGPGPCNDNQFWGTAIEPPETSITHVLVRGPKTNLKLQSVRMEGTRMANPSDGNGPRPLIIIEDDSYGNVMNGILGHTHVQADLNRNPDIDFVTAKSVGIDPAPVNLFENAAFHGFDGENDLPGWNLPGTNRNITKLGDEEKIYHDHNVLHVDYLNFGGSFKLEPRLLPRSPIHSSCTFGIYARSSVPGSIVAAMKYESGSTISSTPHSGGGGWEFIAMSALMDQGVYGPRPTFYITGDVDITAPTFIYGSSTTSPGASLMSASGAVMSGTLTTGLAPVNPPPDSTPDYWILPKEGNVFEIQTEGTPRNIRRISHSTADRFKRGTVVTLLFEEAGTKVWDSGYIKLLGGQDFVSTEHSSLTLITHGSASWTEVSRNN